ncbi:flagellar hook-length control protein FliK [Borrelia crocidurae]|uniref:flagellar hook-length control protein FliK n=1 Tax=Borrelia crocidurae TaxID=29520 RepID=UPI00058D7E31|nr:flagellar hook-length control protein FliK [Borrelia crocidurae]
MSNLSKIIDANLSKLNKSFNFVNGSLLSQDKKGGFADFISSEIQSMSKLRISLLEFLKSNGLINKSSKNLSLNHSFVLEKFKDKDFMSDFKSLLKETGSLFDFESLKNLRENLSFDSEFVDRREMLSNVEKVLSELATLIGDFNFVFNADFFNIGTDFECGDLGIIKKNTEKEKNLISIDIKNFKKNNGVKEFLNTNFRFRLVDNDSSVGKYALKETFDGSSEFIDNLSGSSVKNIKEFFLSQIDDNLMSEWNLKVNRNIVNKAKIVLKSNDTGEIRLILKPKKLGSIRINLNLDSNNNLLGKIIVDNHNVRTLFEQNMYSLNKMLSDNGFNTSLNLSLAGSDLGFSSGSNFKDDFEGHRHSLKESQVFRIEDYVEFSGDLEENVNLIV